MPQAQQAAAAAAKPEKREYETSIDFEITARANFSADESTTATATTTRDDDATLDRYGAGRRLFVDAPHHRRRGGRGHCLLPAALTKAVNQTKSIQNPATTGLFCTRILSATGC
tara:strand:- start:186 stop:527 length:342 start_codon:yes stop_codon:yes gene_type:complete